MRKKIPDDDESLIKKRGKKTKSNRLKKNADFYVILKTGIKAFKIRVFKFYGFLSIHFVGILAGMYFFLVFFVVCYGLVLVDLCFDLILKLGLSYYFEIRVYVKNLGVLRVSLLMLLASRGLRYIFVSYF